MLHKRVIRPNIPETSCCLRVYSMKFRLEKLNYYTFLMSEILDLYFSQAIMNLKAEKSQLDNKTVECLHSDRLIGKMTLRSKPIEKPAGVRDVSPQMLTFKNY